MKKYKIIIVENDEDEQLFMKIGFENSALFEVVKQVNNGNELLEWLETHSANKPEVILSDLNMPGKNGYDIIKEIKNNPGYQHIPVIITSTSEIRSVREKCIEHGAADFIVKPDTFINYEPFAIELHKRVAAIFAAG